MTDKKKLKTFPTAFKLAAIKRLEAGEAVRLQTATEGCRETCARPANRRHEARFLFHGDAKAPKSDPATGPLLSILLRVPLLGGLGFRQLDRFRHSGDGHQRTRNLIEQLVRIFFLRQRLRE
jgi:hypothetical protein